jgi:aqualysin 1
VTDFLLDNATLNHVASAGSGSPNRLLYSVAAAAPTEPPPVTIAVRALSGRSAKVNRDWRAMATVTIRNLSTGAGAPNVTVSGTFAPGGSASCVTTSTGTCTMSSAVISQTIPSTVFTVDGAAANGMTYDGSQNSASQIIIRRR